MKLINTDGIEETLLKAIIASRGNYEEGVANYLKDKNVDISISVTTLTKSVKSHFLSLRNWDQVEIDARSCLPSLVGTIFHKIAEEYPLEGDIVEQRYGRTFKVHLDGKTYTAHVHGACDRYNLEKGYMKDYKFSNMSAMNFDKKDYEQQLNILRFLLPPEQKEKIKQLSNIFSFRDFRYSDMLKGKSPQPTFTKEVFHPIWADEQCKEVLRNRLRAFIRGLHTPSEELPDCTKEELWFSRSGFRIWHKTQKGEWSKVSSGWAETREEAEAIAVAKKKTEFRLEETKGKPNRCNFCDAQAFCKQYRDMMGERTGDEEEEYAEL